MRNMVWVSSISTLVYHCFVFSIGWFVSLLLFPCSRVDNLLNSFVNQTKIFWFFCATEFKPRHFRSHAERVTFKRREVIRTRRFQLNRATRTIDEGLTWQPMEKTKYSASSPSSILWKSFLDTKEFQEIRHLRSWWILEVNIEWIIHIRLTWMPYSCRIWEIYLGNCIFAYIYVIIVKTF